MIFVGVECSSKRALPELMRSKWLHAMKIQSCSQLIGFKRFKTYQFAITRDHCGHIFRSVKAADFQNIAGANHTNLYDCKFKG